MNKTKGWPGLAVLAFSLLSWTGVVLGADSNPWKFLPTRVLEIEGGAVSFQSAVIVDTRQQLSNLLFQDYPTKYILPTTNESSFPIWVEAEWRVPGEKPFASFGKLDPNNYGAFFVKIKEVVWNTPIPVGVSIYADENKKRKLGGRDVVLLFQEEGDEKLAFLESAKKVNTMSEKNAIAHGNKKAWMPLLPGFQEMVDISEPVPGTASDKKLTEDIRLLLWKNQSRHHWDCAHEILGARPSDPTEAAEFKGLSDKDKQLINEGQARGDIAFEEWQIKSCGSVSTYLVLMGKSTQEGTDVMAVLIQEDMSP